MDDKNVILLSRVRLGGAGSIAPMHGLRRRWTPIAVALSIGAASSGADAQSLAEVVEQAWLRHPFAAAFDARDREARAAAERAAGITPGPPEASLSALSDRLNRNDGAQKWEVELGVPLWLPGQRTASAAHAHDALAQLVAQRAALRLAIADEVRTRWWALSAAREARELALRREETARELESDVVRRFEAGDLARMDANLARSERLAARADVVEAQAAVRRAETALQALTGLKPPTGLAAEGAADALSAIEEHPEMRAATAAAQAANAALLVAARSDRDAPRIAVRMERERGVGGVPFSNAVGLKLSIPFSSGPGSRQRIAAALAEVKRTEAERASTKLRLEAEVARARADLEAAEKQLDIAAQRRQFTADNLLLAERSFALGQSDLASLLRTRAAALGADLLLARQRVALGAARSHWNQAIGVLP